MFTFKASGRRVFACMTAGVANLDSVVPFKFLNERKISRDAIFEFFFGNFESKNLNQIIQLEKKK